MTRTPIIAGNWKMNKNIGEAVSLVKELRELVADVKDREIIVCPPFTALSSVKAELAASNVKVGAQNLYFEEEGAFTGEISPLMLKELCSHVIIGHSERRAYFNETNKTVNKRTKVALKNSLTPIVCVGEKLEEREAGKTKDVVKDHVENGLAGLSKEEMLKVVIAYEPVWAIGTGKTATPEQAEEVHVFIRELLKDIFGEKAAEKTRILYGGSVKPKNIKELMAKENIDGGLIGGASLDAKSFSDIVHY
ncbi:triose-phosphate isomerase [Candidatus Woesearchaeota archaeon]|nr:triose-phosphate isomerase [Candidatus Woesearchaeota archaeon]